MAVYVQSARELLTAYLAWKYNDAYVGTPTANETASLLTLNDGYRRFLTGEYVNGAGDTVTHVWSFAKVLAQIKLRAGDEDYDLPLDYAGDVDGYIFDYHTDAVGEELKIVSHPELLKLRRETDDTGLPTHCSVRAKAYVTTTGSLYEWVCYKKPPVATITQVTTTVTRVTGPVFHSGLVGTDIEITGKTDGEVQSYTDEDTVVVDTSQTVATATEAFYETGVTVRYRYRSAMADMTDSATVYPAGLLGCGDLILQAAKMLDEQDLGAIDGTETARFYRKMHEMAVRDKQVIRGAIRQTTIAL